MILSLQRQFYSLLYQKNIHLKMKQESNKIRTPKFNKTQLLKSNPIIHTQQGKTYSIDLNQLIMFKKANCVFTEQAQNEGYAFCLNQNKDKILAMEFQKTQNHYFKICSLREFNHKQIFKLQHKEPYLDKLFKKQDKVQAMFDILSHVNTEIAFYFDQTCKSVEYYIHFVDSKQYIIYYMGFKNKINKKKNQFRFAGILMNYDKFQADRGLKCLLTFWNFIVQMTQCRICFNQKSPYKLLSQRKAIKQNFRTSEMYFQANNLLIKTLSPTIFQQLNYLSISNIRSFQFLQYFKSNQPLQINFAYPQKKLRSWSVFRSLKKYLGQINGLTVYRKVPDVFFAPLFKKLQKQSFDFTDIQKINFCIPQGRQSLIFSLSNQKGIQRINSQKLVKCMTLGKIQVRQWNRSIPQKIYNTLNDQQQEGRPECQII